ncbi:MAG: Fe-S cluster assembly protein HesB, partial [Acidobacteria bacterium]|nr:Fe-S cluster assembly protein HesB [Acidobacteriota bacterium]
MGKKRIYRVTLPANFSFRHTVESHGWYDLAPFRYNSMDKELSYTFTSLNGKPESVSIKDGNGTLSLWVSGEVARPEVIKVVNHILRLDEIFEEFHSLISQTSGLEWAVNANAGRLLRSSTVFEDLVKSLCTTNCSWGLTKKMVTNLVEGLGETSVDGSHAFPTALEMAKQPESYYRNEIRAGYRSSYFIEMAESVASGQI